MERNVERIRHDSLNIDNIVASSPQLGPTPPDGGYGWVVLICAVLVQITVPSVTIAFGIIVLYSNLQREYEENEEFKLWKNNVVLVPILITVFSIISTAWSRQIIFLSNRPRLVSISGIFMVTAGILLSSVGIEAELDAVIFNIFSGLTAGIGTSLALQQSEILLRQYFSKKHHIVQTIYKTSVSFGSVLISMIMGGLLIKFESTRNALTIYSLIILQNCVLLLAYTRPTYITASIQRSYKELKDGSEDEDEIYSSQNDNAASSSNNNAQPIASISIIHEDDNEDEIVRTFGAKNTTKEIIQPSPEAISRLESLKTDANRHRNTPERRVNLDDPQSLYRATTVTNNVVQDNIFTFEPSTNAGTLRRTADVKKHAIILVSALKDMRFYVFTYITFNIRFTMLIVGLLFPAYVSQQIPEMEMWTVTGLIIVAYIGSACLNIVIGFVPHGSNRPFYLALFSLLTFFGLLGLSNSQSKTWLLLSGIWTIFSMTGLYIMEQPLCENMRLEQESNVIIMASNCIIGVIIIFILMIHDYNYNSCFKIAAIFQMITPILLGLIRKKL